MILALIFMLRIAFSDFATALGILFYNSNGYSHETLNLNMNIFIQRMKT